MRNPQPAAVLVEIVQVGQMLFLQMEPANPRRTTFNCDEIVWVTYDA